MSLKHNLDTLQNIAKERTVKTQSIEYDLETLVKKIQKGVIKLDPDYQRRHRWNYATSSKLIESLILNIPVPLIYLSYDIDVDTNEEGARYSVIDGQQRLTAIVRFFENKYPLEGLDILEELDGSFYSDLPPFLLRRLEERTIKCLRIDSTLDQQVKFDIFERLNSGAVKLESHELRNAVLRGPFNDLCKELSKTSSFKRLLQIPAEDSEKNSKVQKMEDVELVLRFFSLIDDNYRNYKKSKDNNFKDFLSDNLDKKNKQPEKESRVDYVFFIGVMSAIYEKFGELAFAKYKLEGEELVKVSSFNAAVYDALAVAVAAEIDVDADEIPISDKNIEDYKNLFRDPQFYEAVSGSILDSAKIVYRIDAVRAIFRK